MNNKDKLLPLLEGIRLLKDDLDTLNDTISDVRRDVTSIEKALKALLREQERADTGKSDFCITVVAEREGQTERIKSVLDIIRELETEEGPAHIDTIVKRASDLGIDKDKVEAEVARLDSEAWIYEPARNSCVYRTTPR